MPKTIVNRAKEKSRTPNSTKGDFAPILSNIQPATREKNKIPSYPAHEYTPLNIPLVSLGKFLLNILSTDMFSIIELKIIKTHTR